MLRLIRWTARVWSVAAIALMVRKVAVEGLDPSAMSGIDWVRFIFFPAGVAGGLIRGWSREALGGSVTIFSLLAFYLVYFIDLGGIPQGWFYAFCAFPGLLYLLCWSMTQKQRN